MKNKTIIIWGAWYGSKNVGDQALLISIADILNEVMSNPRIVVISASPDWVTTYTTRDSQVQLRAISFRKNFFEVVREFAHADYMVFGGGVPFYDDVSHSLAIFIITLLSFFFRVPNILWCVSSQVVKTNFSKLILRALMSRTKVFTCRDSHTFELLMECGADPGRLKIVADSAFTMQPTENNGGAALEMIKRAGSRYFDANNRELVALTPRLIRGMDGEAHTHYSPKSRADSEKELDTYAAVLDWLWNAGYQPLFIPMNTVSPDDDRMAARMIIDRASFGKYAWLVDEMVPPRMASSIYKYCKAGFVSRVHGSITAFIGGCPVAMYAFDKKHWGIMAQMDASDYIFDPAMNTENDAIIKMKALLDNREKTKVFRNQKLIELQESAKIPARQMKSLYH
jgi:polysaccharide pyruvyl transferase WcaK-like protein